MNELPITRPGKVIAVGLNYRDHAAESDTPLPESPILFAKWSTCLVPAGAPIVLPPGVDRADYEAELAVVIGRSAKNVSADDALDFVSGYLALNDVSDRAAQSTDGQWSRAKSYDTARITLDPGDVISTGTPDGVGAFRPVPVFLKPGDEVTVTVEGIGSLTNPVVRGER
jgi:2-keto-4-pentenoate hydratase/2-oxohepta-3-ene-1,7-dioic acid hydratase in catechol pathway